MRRVFREVLKWFWGSTHGKINCAACNADITHPKNEADGRFSIDQTGFATSVAMYPPLRNSIFVCDFTCLNAWRDVERKAQ